MGSLAALVVGVLALLVVLELLDAIHGSLLDGALAQNSKPASPVFPLMVLVMVPGRTVGLFVHELAHAAAQLVFGGRPSIVLLKNGGFARSSPWLNMPPFTTIHGLGFGLGGGIIALAPLLVVASGLAFLVVAATPLTLDGFGELGGALASSSKPWEIVRASSEIFDGARWWLWPAVLTFMILVAPSMTPSTIDYAVGIPFLLAYSIAALVVAKFGLYGALGAGGAGFALLAGWRQLGVKKPFALSFAFALWLSPLALYAIAWIVRRKTGMTPVESIGTGLGMTAFALGFAAVVLAGFSALTLALGMLSRPTMIFAALRTLPRHLAELVLPFTTCEPCGVHFRKRCDGCGRLPDGTLPPKTEEPAGIAGILARAARTKA